MLMMLAAVFAVAASAQTKKSILLRGKGGG